MKSQLHEFLGRFAGDGKVGKKLLKGFRCFTIFATVLNIIV